MSEFAKKASQLADLMTEFNLAEAEISSDDWKVAFRKARANVVVFSDQVASSPAVPIIVEEAAPAAPVGMPISSPMTGIYYSASSPTSPPFVQVGERVEAGQIIALIEAMKVFNEVTASMSGVVQSLPFENGALVNLGDPILFLA